MREEITNVFRFCVPLCGKFLLNKKLKLWVKEIERPEGAKLLKALLV